MAMTRRKPQRWSDKQLAMNGKKMTARAWCRELGLRKGVVYDRLRAGATAEEALRPTPDRTLHTLTAHGRTQSISAWARELGVSIELITTRLGRGDSDEEALREKWMPAQYTYQGVTGTAAQLARKFKKNPQLVCYRVGQGMDIKDAIELPRWFDRNRS